MTGGGIADRLRRVREHFSLSGTQMAERVGLNDRKTWSRYETGDTRPNSDTLAGLQAMGVDANWLLSGEGDMLTASRSRVAGTVPVIGLAECGLRGWFQEASTGLFAAAPAAVAADPDGIAVIAAGTSMLPVGIRPGDLAFCRPADPEEGDSVLVALTDGTLSIKRWVGTAGGWAAVQGWLPPDASGMQMPYTDQRRLDQIRRVLRVVMVQPGGAAPLMATEAASSADDRLYEVAIRAALRWFAAAELEVAPDGLAAMVSRSVGMLRAAGAAGKTDDQLAAEVDHILSVAHQMARTGGFNAKDG